MPNLFALLKMMRRAAPAVVAVSVLAAIIQQPVNAQVSRSDYAARVSAITNSIVAGAAGGTGSGDRPAIFFDLNGASGVSAGDDAVIAGARRLYEIYRALGGPRLGQNAFYERKDGRIYIGLEGQGGRWVDGGVQALEVLREQLVEAAVAQQPVAPAEQPVCRSFECLLLANYKGDAPLAGFVPRGQTQVLELSGKGFSDAGGPPVVLTPAAFYVDSVAFVSAGEVQVTLLVDESATLGAKSLLVFNRGRAFRSVGRYQVHVVASIEELEAIAAGTVPLPGTTIPPADSALYQGGVGRDDDYGNDAKTATDVADGLSGRLERPGDLDVFRLVVPRNATVEITSTGPSDLAAELRDAVDTLIAADDDGGARYNFRISRQLAAGTYFVTVSHCCGGTGSYRFTATQKPQ